MRPHKPPQSLKAFTLIQLLIAIAFLAMIFAYSFKVNDGFVRTSKVDRASIEVQRYFEASIAYYKQLRTWPSAIKDLTDKQLLPEIPDSQGGYLNPWHFPYHLSPDTDASSLTFTLSTEVPSPEIATRLAAVLPNAHVSGNIVYSTISSEGKDNSIIFVGTEQNLASAAQNVCPGSQTGCLSQDKQQVYQQLCQDRYHRIADYEVALQSFSAGATPIADDVAGIGNAHSYSDFYDMSIRKNTVANRFGFTLTLNRELINSKGHDGQAVMFIYCRHPA